jgi:hypothetical protein
MKRTLAVIAVAAALVMPADAAWWGADPPKKIDLSNIRDVLANLMPLTDGTNYTDAHVYVFGDGTVHIYIKTSSGTEMRGRGDSVEIALQDLLKSATGVTDALKPLMPTQ